MSSVSVLPLEEIVDIVHAPNAADLIIGARLEPNLGRLVLLRGDLTLLVVPLLFFADSNGRFQPDAEPFSVIDYGHTVKFGEYEISTDAILYELDPAFRERYEQRRATEPP